jgi:hypothetical protein
LGHLLKWWIYQLHPVRWKELLWHIKHTVHRTESRQNAFMGEEKKEHFYITSLQFQWSEYYIAASKYPKLNFFREFISCLCFYVSRHASDLAHIPIHAAESLHDIHKTFLLWKPRKVHLLTNPGPLDL